jgi:uncharacterized membrane protein YqjE
VSTADPGAPGAPGTPPGRPTGPAGAGQAAGPAAGPAAAGRAAREEGPAPEDVRSTSEVVTSLVANGQALVNKELELAKHELSEVVRDKAIAIGLVIFAAILGLFILGFIGVTTAVALSLVLPAWAAWLIVTGLYILAAVVLVLIAVRLLKRPAFARTKASIEELRAWAKEQMPS